MEYIDKVQVGSSTYDIRDSNATAAIQTGVVGPAYAATTNYGQGGVLMPSVTVAIEPVQDLHGYDNPWPAGGGKNLLPKKSHQQSSSRLDIGTDDGSYRQYAAGTYTISYTADETASIYYQKDGGSSTSLGSGYSKSVTLEDGRYRFWLYRSSGLPDNIDNWQLELGSTATTYAPYSNVCPISGHTSVSVVRTGKNLLPANFSAYSVNNNYTYLNNVVPEGQTARFTFVDKDTTVDISSVSIGFQLGLGNASVPSDYRWVLRNSVMRSDVSNIGNDGSVCTGVFIYPNTEAAFNAVFARYYVMVELGSTATTYEPYQGTTITDAIPTPPGTVYGGTLDLVTGELVVDRAIVDLGDYTWTQRPASPSIYYTTGITGLDSTVGKTAVVSSALAGKPTTDNWNAVLGYGDNTVTIKSQSTLYVAIVDSKVADAATLKTNLSGVKLVYTLATPVTYQLTPQQITALAGTNVLMSAAGQITATVPIDLKAYVDARLAEVQALILENAGN